MAFGGGKAYCLTGMVENEQAFPWFVFPSDTGTCYGEIGFGLKMELDSLSD